MRYLYLPGASEELSVRGHYVIRGSDGSLIAEEQWERYRNPGSEIETMRSERQSEQGLLLSHTLFGPEGVERVQLRWRPRVGAPSRLSLTLSAEGALLTADGTHHEFPLPEGRGLVLPIVALGRHTLPFSLAAESVQRDQVLWLGEGTGAWSPELTPTRFEPLGLRDREWKGKRLRLKGWQLSAWGRPTQSAWFDRHGTCFAWQLQTGEQTWQATLASWMTFG